MSVVIFILILAVLIIAHEYGHFIVAKKWGIRVDEFGLGYPPRAKVLFKRKGTLFTLNWVPFGGFVKIFGEDPADKELLQDEKGEAMTAKPRYAQAMVLFAGPFFNFLFAWIVILAALFLGLPSASTPSNQEHISESRTIVTNVFEGSPADLAGIMSGDIIESVSADGREYEALHQIDFGGLAEDSVIVSLRRDGELVTATIVPDGYMVEGAPGVGVGYQEAGIYKPPFFRAIVDSFRITGSMIYEITIGLGTLIADAFKGDADISSLTGPVGIVALVGDASTLGFVYLLTFTALISVNLGVINLIPFPALDGGRILFLAIEKMRGAPISPRIANILNSLGFLLLIALMIFITFRDVMNLL